MMRRLFKQVYADLHFFVPIYREGMNGERRSHLKGGEIMTKNMTELSKQYADLTALADKLQNKDQLSAAAMQTLSGILAKIAILELMLFGEANIYCSSRRNEQADDAPF